ncbi:hypothetical protein JOS77_02920 [Chromobacterium haemolyticum]|nr:hypothetical protein JOS77_02920 [Chromobacterium haemolyticum]
MNRPPPNKGSRKQGQQHGPGGRVGAQRAIGEVLRLHFLLHPNLADSPW